MRRELLNFYPQIGASGDFVKLNPVENIAVEILTILISPTGEKSTRVWNLDFGSEFLDSLFDLADSGIETTIKERVYSALRKDLDDVQVSVDNVNITYDTSGKVLSVDVTIGFTYDDNKYVAIYNLPNNEMLLEAPTYKVKKAVA